MEALYGAVIEASPRRMRWVEVESAVVVVFVAAVLAEQGEEEEKEKMQKGEKAG